MSDLSIPVYKVIYRRKSRHLLREMNPRDQILKSHDIFEKLSKSPCFKRAKNIFCFIGLLGEVNTLPAIEKMILEGKKVFVPKVNFRLKTMDIYQLRYPRRELAQGPYGIWEPDPKKCPKGRSQDLDLLLIPGLAFDRKGRRLGRGEGYFDRFLNQTKKVWKIGLAYQEQILPEVPVEAHDICVNQILVA